MPALRIRQLAEKDGITENYLLMTTPMTPVSRAILTTVAYFDQFGRALTKSELHSLMWDLGAFPEAVDHTVRDLIKHNILQQDRQYFGLSSHTLLVTLKRQGLIADWRDRALRIASILSKIRGIKSIILMNSLAMQTCYEDSDIDLLIITDPKSLYLSRTVGLLNLKVRGLAKSKSNIAGRACLGYWLPYNDLAVLQYQTETHTAAYWVATMVPLFGLDGYQNFIKSNGWVYQYLPNWIPHQTAHLSGNNQANAGAISNFFNHILFPFHRARILADPEFADSPEKVVAIDRLKLHSKDLRPGYAKKMQSILDILFVND